jgi:hypothetical protein
MMDGKGAGLRVKSNGENSGRRGYPPMEGVFGDSGDGGSGDEKNREIRYIYKHRL